MDATADSPTPNSAGPPTSSTPTLTIGFARRAATYKRLTLMLRDPERLRAILTNPDRLVQLVIAGKAHPADDGGKALIQQVVRFTEDPNCVIG